MSNDAVAAPLRPPPPAEAPEGEHWEAVEAPAEWGTAGPGKNCRWRGSRDASACGGEASVRRRRGVRRRVDWNYCGAHALSSYGVWAEAGKVMTWRLADDPPGGSG